MRIHDVITVAIGTSRRSLRCNNSAAIGGKADLAAIQRHVYGFTPKFIRLTLSPLPPPCAPALR